MLYVLQHVALLAQLTYSIASTGEVERNVKWKAENQWQKVTHFCSRDRNIEDNSSLTAYSIKDKKKSSGFLQSTNKLEGHIDCPCFWPTAYIYDVRKNGHFNNYYVL